MKTTETASDAPPGVEMSSCGALYFGEAEIAECRVEAVGDPPLRK
jgi:hypothetical protein